MFEINTFVFTKMSSNTTPMFVLTQSTLHSEDISPAELVANNYGSIFLYKKITDGTLVLSNANTTIIAESGNVTPLAAFPIGEPVNVRCTNGSTTLLLFKPARPLSCTFTNIDIVDVSLSYVLPVNTYAIVVEGSASVTTTGNFFYIQRDDTTQLIVDGPYAANSANGNHCIKASPNSITITGECKLVTFNITND